MFAEYAINVLAVAVAFAGLTTVVTEIAIKDPSIFREIVTDVRRMATPDAARRDELADRRAARTGGTAAGEYRRAA